MSSSVTASDGPAVPKEPQQEASDTSQNVSEGDGAAPPGEQPPESAGEEGQTPVTPTPKLATADRYDYEHTTIVLVVQMRPVVQEGHPRRVYLSVQNGVGNEQEFPLYCLTTEAQLGGPWPPAVAQLLEALRQDLPARRERSEAKHAAKPVPLVAQATMPRATTASGTSKGTKAVAKQPPVPISTNPIPKAGLSMTGLFDDDETDEERK